MQIVRRLAVISLGCLALALVPSSPVTAQEVSGNRISCASQLGSGRVNCPADTSAGVVLLQSKGESACLLGRTWGYEDRNIWVTDGCSCRVSRRTTRGPGRHQGGAPFFLTGIRSQCRIHALRGGKRPDLHAPDDLCALPEPEGPGLQLHRLLRQHQDGGHAPGRAAQQVLPAVLGLVPVAEIPLLPLRVVVESIAGRAGPGGGRRQYQLCASTAS